MTYTRSEIRFMARAVLFNRNALAVQKRLAMLQTLSGLSLHDIMQRIYELAQ
jgi:hypothetical protein